MLPFATLLLSAVMFGPVALEPITENAVLEAPTRHIRTTHANVRTLLRRGFRESPSFAALVRRLQQSDVYVYVEEVDRLPGALEGRLMMLPRAHEHRYVRIQLAMRGSPEDCIATLGHELQHAVEIAGAQDVFDQEGMTRLYQKIGIRGGVHLYDTAAAQQMGRTVRRELA
jgi:hypothetical protein